MAETAKPSKGGATGRRKTPAQSTRKTASKAKTTEKAKSAAAEPKKDAASAATDNGQHVRITPPPAKSGSGGTWAVVLLLVIVVGGAAGYASWPRWYPLVAPYLPKQFPVTVEDPRVAGLEMRVGELEGTAAAPKKKDAAIQRLEEERAKLSESLTGVLQRIESIEHSIGAVKEMAKTAASAEEAARASKSLKALNERLTSLEAAPRAETTAAPDLAARLAKLERDRTVASELVARIAKLEADGAASREERAAAKASLAKSESAVAAVENRLGELEKRPASGGAASGKGSAIVLAVAQLRDAVHGGGAFGKELQAVKALAGDDPGMKAPLVILEKYAGSGIGTLTVLRDEFSELAGRIVVAGQAKGDGGWFDSAVNRVSSLVTLRRVDGAGESASVETLVAQAENRLAAGDLIAAVKSVEALKAAAQPAFETAGPWLARAKARLAAERSLATLHIHAVSLLSPAKE